MNAACLDDCIQNKRLLKHLGICYFELQRYDEAYKFLKMYIKLEKVSGNLKQMQSKYLG